MEPMKFAYLQDHRDMLKSPTDIFQNTKRVHPAGLLHEKFKFGSNYILPAAIYVYCSTFPKGAPYLSVSFNLGLKDFFLL